MLVARRSAGKVELASGTNSTARSYSLEMASGPNVVRQRDQGELQAVASRARAPAPQLNARASALLARYFGFEGPQHDGLLRRAIARRAAFARTGEDACAQTGHSEGGRGRDALATAGGTPALHPRAVHNFPIPCVN